MSKFADIEIDPAIIQRAARGDARAHEILYRAFAGPVYSLALRFTRVPAQAEDLTQETFIEIMRSLVNFRGEAALGSWIRRIAVTKSLMYLRSAWTARSRQVPPMTMRRRRASRRRNDNLCNGFVANAHSQDERRWLTLQIWLRR